jgi:hypothetical protein
MNQDSLKLEHCQRVSHACERALQHASFLLDASMQDFVNEILARGPTHMDSCLREIKKREGASLPERRLLEGLRIVVSRLWRGDVWLCRGHYETVLAACWSGVAEEIDRANGERLDGPLQVAEQAYQRDFVLPIIEESFKTMWAAQEEISKELKKQKTQEKKLEKLRLKSFSGLTTE